MPTIEVQVRACRRQVEVEVLRAKVEVLRARGAVEVGLEARDASHGAALINDDASS